MSISLREVFPSLFQMKKDFKIIASPKPSIIIYKRYF